MVVPAGQTVQITLVSDDVIHGFYVRDFNFSRYALPGVTNHFDLDVLHTGHLQRPVHPDLRALPLGDALQRAGGQPRRPSAPGPAPRCEPGTPCQRSGSGAQDNPPPRHPRLPIEVATTRPPRQREPHDDHDRTPRSDRARGARWARRPRARRRTTARTTTSTTRARPGILNWLTSTDHKVIGKSYMITSLVLFFIAGIMALVIRAQLATPTSSLVSFQTYNELFTMHGSLMLYLFAGPFAFGGLANYIVPLQVGAPDMAFPRLNALSYWLYLGGSITMMSGLPGGRRGGQLRLGGLRPAVQRHQLPRGRRRPVAHGPRPHRVLGHLHRGQPVRHHLLPAGPGHDHVPGPHLLLEHAGHRHPHPHRLPGPVRGDGACCSATGTSAPTSSPCRAVVCPCCGRTSSGSSAIPRCTSWPCPTSASSPTSSRSSPASPCSATRAWSSPPCPSPPCPPGCGPTTCSPPAWCCSPSSPCSPT